MALLQANNLDNDNNEQSEIFAIGATILCTGILGDFSNVYNLKERAYDIEALKNKRREWGDKNRYSDIFRAIVLNLVSVSP